MRTRRGRTLLQICKRHLFVRQFCAPVLLLSARRDEIQAEQARKLPPSEGKLMQVVSSLQTLVGSWVFSSVSLCGRVYDGLAAMLCECPNPLNPHSTPL